MLIIYDQTGEIQGISGPCPEGRKLSEAEKTVTLAEPLPPEHSTITIKEEALMDAIWASHKAGARIELVLDEQGNAVGVKPFTPITAKAAPNPVHADEIVEVAAVLPTDTQDTHVAFQIEGGSAIPEDIFDGQASHSYVFTMPGTYQIQVSSVNHGRAVVEVVVI